MFSKLSLLILACWKNIRNFKVPFGPLFFVLLLHDLLLHWTLNFFYIHFHSSSSIRRDFFHPETMSSQIQAYKEHQPTGTKIWPQPQQRFKDTTLSHSLFNQSPNLDSSLPLWRSQHQVARGGRIFLPLSTKNRSPSTPRRRCRRLFTIAVARKPAARVHASSVTAFARATRRTAKPASGSTWSIRIACASLPKRRHCWRRGEGSGQTACSRCSKPDCEEMFH